MEVAMDGSRFDAWTRRRFSVSAGGLAASLSLLSLASLDVATARNKKKRRNKKKKKANPCICPQQPICKNLLESCDPNVAAQHCCPGLNCGVVAEQDGLRCCLGVRSRCTSTTNQCCSQLSCNKTGAEGIIRCCADLDGVCASDDDCCSGLSCRDGACKAITSDRNLKANVGSVDATDMLARVRELPISTWNYTSDDPSVRHIGPMAQDFAPLFGVGADDRHIHPVDGQGVALAAIQGLLAEVETLREENARLAARLDALEASRSPHERTKPVSQHAERRNGR
jgi:hypothetical protein